MVNRGDKKIIFQENTINKTTYVVD